MKILQRSIRWVAAIALIWGGGLAALGQPTLERLEKSIRERTDDAAEPVAGAKPPAEAGRPAGYLGLTADDANDRGRGVRVLAVRAGGPAAAAGLKANDLITAIAGVRVRRNVGHGRDHGPVSRRRYHRHGRPARRQAAASEGHAGPTAGRERGGRSRRRPRPSRSSCEAKPAVEPPMRPRDTRKEPPDVGPELRRRVPSRSCRRPRRPRSSNCNAASSNSNAASSSWRRR